MIKINRPDPDLSVDGEAANTKATEITPQKPEVSVAAKKGERTTATITEAETTGIDKGTKKCAEVFVRLPFFHCLLQTYVSLSTTSYLSAVGTIQGSYV
jgi:hypothetical protein